MGDQILPCAGFAAARRSPERRGLGFVSRVLGFEAFKRCLATFGNARNPSEAKPAKLHSSIVIMSRDQNPRGRVLKSAKVPGFRNRPLGY